MSALPWSPQVKTGDNNQRDKLCCWCVHWYMAEIKWTKTALFIKSPPVFKPAFVTTQFISSFHVHFHQIPFQPLGSQRRGGQNCVRATFFHPVFNSFCHFFIPRLEETQYALTEEDHRASFGSLVHLTCFSIWCKDWIESEAVCCLISRLINSLVLHWSDKCAHTHQKGFTTGILGQSTAAWLKDCGTWLTSSQTF